MKGSNKGVTVEYTRPSRKYNCIRGSDAANSMHPGFVASSLSFSVFTKKAIFKWYIIRGTNLTISRAIPAQPSIMMYVMKKVAFIGIDTPIVFGILH